MFVLLGLCSLALAAGVILRNFNNNLVFFYAPAELATKNIPAGKIIRIGGLIEKGSVHKSADSLTTEFILTDLTARTTVRYKGILPPMFREEQGMVARGTLENGVLQADQLLTKHDENYMPPEVTDALKKSGRWEGK